MSNTSKANRLSGLDGATLVPKTNTDANVNANVNANASANTSGNSIANSTPVSNVVVNTTLREYFSGVLYQQGQRQFEKVFNAFVQKHMEARFPGDVDVATTNGRSRQKMKNKNMKKKKKKQTHGNATGKDRYGSITLKLWVLKIRELHQ